MILSMLTHIAFDPEVRRYHLFYSNNYLYLHISSGVCVNSFSKCINSEKYKLNLLPTNLSSLEK